MTHRVSPIIYDEEIERWVVNCYDCNWQTQEFFSADAELFVALHRLERQV